MKEKYKILIVDDEQSILDMLKLQLEFEGYTVYVASNAKEALDNLSYSPDIILLDINMSGMNGLDLCVFIRDFISCPIIFLTARVSEQDKINGLMAGGDDYITKPFRINELLSRMRSVQRRYHRQEEDIVQIQYLSIYPKQGKVYREQEEVLLTALEYRLLMVFINHPQQVLSRSQLLEGIWDAAGDFVNDNTLTVYIKRLREKLERDPQNPSIIVTVRGLGYRLELHHAA